MNIFIVLILYGLVFLSCEIAYRKFGLPFLASRKMAHFIGSVVSFLLPFFISSGVAVNIGLLFAVFLFVSKRKNFFKSIHEKGGGIGEITYPLGIAISAFLIWPLSTVAYQGSCLVLGLSDGLAGYIGKTYGKKKILYMGGKTVEGSSVFLLFTLIVFCVYYLLYTSKISVPGILLLFIYALVVTFVEAALSHGWDNLFIPIMAGVTLLLFVA